jgi:LAO/AO transport system kinase
MEAAELIRRAAEGQRRFLARAITWVELRHAAIGAALAGCDVRRHRAPGAPHVIGITGPPGAGKSTFVDAIVRLARDRGQRVAVVAVDPSSPFSGGAILGDRVRMERHTGDDGVYIRSLSSRGHLGGLSAASTEIVDLLDVCGFDLVLVETVGVGQSELGIMEVADTVVVVLTPESGDAVQAMKAGLLEIADVFVVNKADRPGADRMARELARAVALDDGPWRPEVRTAVAREGEGVDAVVAAAAEHLAFCVGEGRERWARRRGDARLRLYLDLVAEQARVDAAAALTDEHRDALRAGTLSPYRLVHP